MFALLSCRRARFLGVLVGLLATLVIAPLLGACRGGAESPGGLGIAMSVSPDPPGVGRAEVAVRVTQANGDPVKGARVQVEGNMSHAGMVPVVAPALEGEGGRYVVPDFRFTMAGDWVLTVSVFTSDGQKAERAFKVDGVGGGRR